MLTADELESVLSGGREFPGLEVKGPGLRTDNQLFAQVTRAALGLGNRRDGGHIVVGIEDGAIADMIPGLDDEQLQSWLAYDDVARKLAEYSDPALRFDIADVTLTNGCQVALIQVYEFADLPHLCSKAFEPTLRKGALYVRPRKVPETSELADSVEMRELLDLATEKALRRFFSTVERAGLRLAQGGEAEESSTAQYENERDGVWE